MQSVLVRAPGRRQRARLGEERLQAPAVRDAHPLRVAGVDRLVGRLAGERIEDLDQRLVEQVADRQLGLHAARVDRAVRLDRDLGAAVAVVQEAEAARPAVAEVVGDRRGREAVRSRPGRAARSCRSRCRARRRRSCTAGLPPRASCASSPTGPSGARRPPRTARDSASMKACCFAAPSMPTWYSSMLATEIM